MINVSNEFKELMKSRTDFKCKADVEFADGETLTLDGSAFTLSNNSISDSASASSFPLGVAMSRTIQIELLNDDDQYEAYDFFGAKITLSLSFKLSETTETIQLGKFTVLEPETYGDTVIITARDDMYKADKKYVTSLTYPATISQMFLEICQRCSLPINTVSFKNANFTVQTAPTGDLTFRQVLGYIAMIAGGNVRISREGYVRIMSYDLDTRSTPQHVLDSWKSLKTDTSDITVTGIQTTAEAHDSDSEDVTYTFGDEGYMLSVENPLITGQEEAALQLIGAGFIGVPFRKFSGDYIAYPLIEFMDTVQLTDRKGNTFNSFVTDVNFTFFGITTLSNSAESALRNNSLYTSPETKAIIAAKKLVEQEKTAREIAMEQLNNKLELAGGFYSTDVTQDDGSTIRYMHDKPTLAESQNVIKITASAIGFSTDGGETYPFGLAVNGEVVASILAAEGINADWINTGALTVKDSDGNIVFKADTDTGEVVISTLTDVQKEVERLDSKIEGIDGTYFYIRYSAYADGHDMTATPTDETQYMGTCSTNEETAPTDYTEYTWCKVKGTDGKDGADGENATVLRIDSSDGFSLKDNETSELTARVIEGTKDIDPLGTEAYTWYKRADDGEYSAFAQEKTATVSAADYTDNMDVYFVYGSENGETETMAFGSYLQDVATFPPLTYTETKNIGAFFMKKPSTISGSNRRAYLKWDVNKLSGFSARAYLLNEAGEAVKAFCGSNGTLNPYYGAFSGDLDENAVLDIVTRCDFANDLTHNFSFPVPDGYTVLWEFMLPAGSISFPDGTLTKVWSTEAEHNNTWVYTWIQTGIETTVVAESTASEPITSAPVRFNKTVDGQTQYLHVKYSDDGETFTENDGDELGAWIGTLVDFNEEASTNFDGYTWKKFTEDVDEELEEIRTSITERYTAAVNTSESIILSALENYVETSNYEEFKQTLETQLKVMADEIQMNFTTTTEQITSVDGDLQTKFTELYKYISFKGGAITLGASDSAITLTIENDNIVFRKNGVEFGSWDGNYFYTGNIYVRTNESARFGNFEFKPREDGSLMLVKVGE